MSILTAIFALAIQFAEATSTPQPKDVKEAADHKHSKDEKHDNEGHAEEKDEHGEEAQEPNDSVGPEKGILEANEDDGFKLSPEALKHFELKYVSVLGAGQVTIPKTAVVYAGEEVNLYRVRNGFIKRIDFQTVRRGQGDLTVSSKQLSPGDQVVVVGIGFLRIAELAAFGGMAEGHSH